MRLISRLTEARQASRPVAVARIGVGAAVLLEALNSSRVLWRLADPAVIKTPYLASAPEPSAALAVGLSVLWVGAAVAFVAGWRTRVAGGLLATTMAAVLLLDQQLYSNHLYLMVLVTGLLSLADCGAAISLDAIRGRPRDTVPGWPVWLLRIQVSLVYGYAALSKLNLAYLSGSVLASSLRRGGPLALPADWRSAEPMLVLAVIAICIEGGIAVGLWFTRWRATALVAGLSLHAGITIWMSPTTQLLIFSMLMLPLYLLFAAPPTRELTVVWDDSCGFCAGWVRWFRRLDWLHALRFVPRSRLPDAGLPVSEGAAATALQAVGPTGVHAGFRAVVDVASVLPVSFLWAPALRIRPVLALGERAYRRVAARRTCPVPVSRQGPVGS